MMVRTLGLGLVIALGCAPLASAAEPAAAAHAAAAVPERGDDADRSSKNGVAMGKVAGADVIVHYGRPKVNGRAVWGELVPFGEVWRAGADEATTVTLSAATRLGDTALEAGTYALFAIPGEKEWTIILNDQPEQWGAYKYDKSHDVARVTVTPQAAPDAEELTFTVSEGKLWLHWAKLRVPVPLVSQ